jgi:basic membrane protein A
MRGHDIEADLAADINGNDAGAGFDHGWVEMLELNNNIATEGSDEVESKLIAGFENKSIEVFAGDFTGTDPLNSSDTISLTKPYKENEGSSAPSFHYVLDDVITIIE